MQCLRCGGEIVGSKAMCDRCLAQGRLLSKPTAFGKEPEVRNFDDAPVAVSTDSTKSKVFRDRGGESDVVTAPMANGSVITGYAGFWLRVWGYIIDATIVGVVALLIQLVAGALVISLVTLYTQTLQEAGSIGTMVAGVSAVLFVSLMFAGIAGILYYVLFETSRFQATPGKILMGLVVTDGVGCRLNIFIALVRYFSRAVPWIAIIFGLISILVIGGSGLIFVAIGILLVPAAYIMTAFTEHKQALHDKIAGTLVCRTEKTTTSRCRLAAAIAIILLIVSAIFGAKDRADKNQIRFKNYKDMQVHKDVSGI